MTSLSLFNSKESLTSEKHHNVPSVHVNASQTSTEERDLETRSTKKVKCCTGHLIGRYRNGIRDE